MRSAAPGNTDKREERRRGEIGREVWGVLCERVCVRVGGGGAHKNTFGKVTCEE